jgi:hypothetical protein
MWADYRYSDCKWGKEDGSTRCQTTSKSQSPIYIYTWSRSTLLPTSSRSTTPNRRPTQTPDWPLSTLQNYPMRDQQMMKRIPSLQLHPEHPLFHIMKQHPIPTTIKSKNKKIHMPMVWLGGIRDMVMVKNIGIQMKNLGIQPMLLLAISLVDQVQRPRTGSASVKPHRKYRGKYQSSPQSQQGIQSTV